MARSRPTLTVALILAWADDHHARTGEWPRIRSGPVRASPGERWQQIDAALRHGHRGLAGGSSLPQLLAAERGCRNHRGVQALTVCQILAWADDHRAHHGDWPRIQSGPVRARPGETWRRLDNALRHGGRGLPGGSSLHQLLRQRRRKRRRGPTRPPARPKQGWSAGVTGNGRVSGAGLE